MNDFYLRVRATRYVKFAHMILTAMVMVGKMKTLTSKIYGEVAEPSSFQELIELTLDPAPDEYLFARMCGGASRY